MERLTGYINPLGALSGSVKSIGSVCGGIAPITSDYRQLRNLPSIEGVTLIGDKTFPELGLNTLSVQEIESILYLN